MLGVAFFSSSNCGDTAVVKSDPSRSFFWGQHYSEAGLDDGEKPCLIVFDSYIIYMFRHCSMWILLGCACLVGRPLNKPRKHGVPCGLEKQGC